MNYTPVTGWYYKNVNLRTASWSGVEYLYNFLINNTGAGPFGKEVDVDKVLPGDISQLSFDGNKFAHSQVIVDNAAISDISNIQIASHTFDSDYRSLSTYSFLKVRFIHIDGVRI